MISARTEDGFKKILRLLRRHSSVDFSLYKSSTMKLGLSVAVAVAILMTT
jgi:hypothetical protein